MFFIIALPLPPLRDGGSITAAAQDEGGNGQTGRRSVGVGPIVPAARPAARWGSQPLGVRTPDWQA